MVSNCRKAVNHALALWAVLFVIGAASLLAESHYPYFAGDVPVTRWVQSLFPADLTWARIVSTSAEFPWLLIIMVIVIALSWALAGWRAAVLSILSLAGILALGWWLGPLIGRPRPSPELVRVLKPLHGYSFPSMFALRYAAAFGFLVVLACMRGSGWVRTIALIICVPLLIIGWFARVALAAHWPSDVTISYYLGLLWAALLIQLGSSDSPAHRR
jgi:membrane-associated phospholipid phosphatase